jgi:hypothetical protein
MQNQQASCRFELFFLLVNEALQIIQLALGDEQIVKQECGHDTTVPANFIQPVTREKPGQCVCSVFLNLYWVSVSESHNKVTATAVMTIKILVMR